MKLKADAAEYDSWATEMGWLNNDNINLILSGPNNKEAKALVAYSIQRECSKDKINLG